MGRIWGLAALVAGIWLLSVYGHSMPQALGSDAPATAFSESRADAALGRVLGDEVLRSRLSKGALARARWFTWDATARRALEALAEEATPAT